MGSTKLLWLNFKFDFDLPGGQRYLLPFAGLEEAAIPQDIGSTSDTDSLRKFLNLGDLEESNRQLFRLPRAPLYFPCQKTGFLSLLDKKYLSSISICVEQVISGHFDPNINFFLIEYGQKPVQLINQQHSILPD